MGLYLYSSIFLCDVVIDCQGQLLLYACQVNESILELSWRTEVCVSKFC